MDQVETPGQRQGQAGGRSDAVVAVQCSSQVIDTVAVGIPPGERAKKFCPDAPAIQLCTSMKLEEKNSAPQKHAKKSNLPEVSSSRSSPPDTNADLCYIDKLPNEMLQKIFHELTLQTDSGSSSDNLCYLNCRLVSSHWKSGMETVLEANALSTWKKISIPIFHTDILAEPPKMGKLLVLKTEEWFDPTEWAFLPRPLETAGDNANPFPSRTLKITSLAEVSASLYNWTRNRASQLIQFTPFFSKFGHHLTFLILKSLTLTPESLQGILENIPNLKALTLIRIYFRMDLSECVQLPALEKLQYLRILAVESATINKDRYVHDENEHERKQLYQWIISPYKKQLLTLDTDGLGEAGHLSEFPALERLVVSGLDEPNFVEPRIVSNPPLKCLCLTKLDFEFSEDRIQWMLRIISPFAESLSDLYLDFSRSIHRQLVVKGALLKLPSKTARERIKTVSFLEMRTLVIPFPAYPEEVLAIKEMLKWFPNLETLTFLVAIVDDTRPVLDAQKDMEQEEYRKVCPKLKKIKIGDVNTFDLFYRTIY